MVLVGYSDSEGSDNESIPIQPPRSNTRSAAAIPTLLVDKSNPKKIVVNLTDKSVEPGNDAQDEHNEPPLKRARVGAGAFSGFNAMLPPPKRDHVQQERKKAPARKVFSLRTGAEPAFSRDSDAELKDVRAQDPLNQSVLDDPADEPGKGMLEVVPKVTGMNLVSSDVTQAKPFLFKPLSVAQSRKKKKTTAHIPANSDAERPAHTSAVPNESDGSLRAGRHEKETKKISLFYVGVEEDTTLAALDETVDAEDDPIEHASRQVVDHSTIESPHILQDGPDPNSLTSIADSLNLSAAERRQLLGRNHNPLSGTASRVINFNTDTEYAANQQLNAMGEQVQHNPVRTIAPGKHSLKSLVASAQGQKEALEESFAQGRRNKRETGNKYGW